jgi:site-specific DNA-methyltransferase (adenine-specific)
MTIRYRPGEIRDAILAFLRSKPGGDASIAEIYAGVEDHFGHSVPRSSVRSSLNFGTGNLYERTARGRYRLKK